MFDFGGFTITGVLFSSVFPDTDCTQAILMKGRMHREMKDKLLFAIIEKQDDGTYSVFDEVILPLPAECSDAARIAEVTIGDALTTATLKILVETSEIAITLTDIDIEVYSENYIFTPAPNMLDIPLD